MNKIFLRIYILSLLIFMNPINAIGDDGQLIRNTLKQFFSLLKSGNVSAIESAIGEDILEETKVLLRKNKEYGKFLRIYYKGADFQLKKIVELQDGVIVDVDVVFNDKDTQQYSFFLIKEHADKEGGEKWKVVRQQSRLSPANRPSKEMDIQ